MKGQIALTFLLAAAMSLPLQPQSTLTVKGKASYYHDMFHGRRTASGSRYHRDSLTCAHLKYPFGTLLRVRNVHNGKDVVVKVTDRGPYSSRYIIDLSRAAARHLDILNHGHGDVEISVCLDGRVPFKPLPDTLRLLPIALLDTIPDFVPPPLGLLP